MMVQNTNIIRDEKIYELLEKTRKTSREELFEIIEKSKNLKGLDDHDIACILNSNEPQVLSRLFDAAKYVKNTIYGDRLVLFAPLYISNICKNDCAYCAFRVSNRHLKRKALNKQEIFNETENLIKQGHKRLLLVAGEAYPGNDFNYVLDAIDTVYSVHKDLGNIRRLNVNIAPLEQDEFIKLKEKGIGTYQLFQETYHRPTYLKVHIAGRKRDYDWRISAVDRAFKAKIDDVGIGVLFGLYDYRFEIMAMMQHIRYLESEFGVGPHTISVPRMEPADGAPISDKPEYPVSDMDFRKIVALLRVALPYTGIIMSTRENPDTRRDTLALGVSQISAGSRTNPGGYTGKGYEEDCSQFSLGDHRSLDEVIRDISGLGYIPSFCTACYRLGRTGQDFMDMAKPGEIKYHCGPNALSTFMEYLMDYATEETREIGEKLIEEKINSTGDPRWRTVARSLVDNVKLGKRDCFV